MNKRIRWFAWVTLVVMSGIGFRLVLLQGVRHAEYAAIARKNITKTSWIVPERGMLFDRLGQVIAKNRLTYDLYVVPSTMTAERRVRLITLLQLGENERLAINEKLDRVPANRQDQRVMLLKDIPSQARLSLETHRKEFPHLSIVTGSRREYPFGSLGAHAVGYMGEPDVVGGQYNQGEQVGKYGIEKWFESSLRGERGREEVVTRVHIDPTDRKKRYKTTEAIRRDQVKAGHHIHLTLDMDMMRATEKLFAPYPSGAVVVVDTGSGAVRVLYSKPAFDINAMAIGVLQHVYQKWIDDPNRPLTDKTMYESYFPGSTFKPFTALALLEAQTMDRTERVMCSGRYKIGTDSFKCNGVHHHVGLEGALTQSCNVYFYRAAELMGIDPIASMARRFGFGQKTGLGINDEASGLIPDRHWYETHHERVFRPGHALLTGIGQGDVKVTVLQLAMAYAALANGGTVFEPYLWERVTDAQGNEVKRHLIREKMNAQVAPADFEMLRRGLVAVVNHSTGSAFHARIEQGISIAGKTGTAEIKLSHNAQALTRSHAWFAGYAPAERPRYAIAVLVEHGGTGGVVSAPLGIQLLNQMLERDSQNPTGSSARAGN